MTYNTNALRYFNKNNIRAIGKYGPASTWCRWGVDFLTSNTVIFLVTVL